MSASNVNVVVITGNLTRDPEIRHTGGGTAVCDLRVAVNGRRKTQSGNWVNKPNYFDVTCFGARAENAVEYLAKGRPVAVEGRLNWSEWEAKDGSGKRHGVKIIANHVQFLGKGGGSESGQDSSTEATTDSSTPDAEEEPAGVDAAGETEEDISF